MDDHGSAATPPQGDTAAAFQQAADVIDRDQPAAAAAAGFAAATGVQAVQQEAAGVAAQGLGGRLSQGFFSGKAFSFQAEKGVHRRGVHAFRGGGAPKIPYMRPQARRQDVSNWRFAWAVHGIEAHVQHKRHSAAGAVWRGG